MSLELICKLEQHLPEQTGTGKNGAWVKQDFVVETIDNYPKKVCMSAWGDMVKQIQTYTPGTTLKISFRLESREYNGRWYTDVRPWRMELATATGVPAANGYAPQQAAPTTAAVGADPMGNSASENDDLPF